MGFGLDYYKKKVPAESLFGEEGNAEPVPYILRKLLLAFLSAILLLLIICNLN